MEIMIVVLFVVSLIAIYFWYKSMTLLDEHKDLTDKIDSFDFAYSLCYRRCVNWKNAIKIHEKESGRVGLYQEIENVFVDLEKEDEKWKSS